MRCVVFEGHSKMHMEEQPKPEPKQGEALIAPAYTGVCGSDLTLYAGKNPRARLPVVPGHEFTGRVVELADRNQNIAVGDRVAVLPTITCGSCELCRSGRSHLCRSLRFLGIQMPGSMAEFVSAPIENLFPVPEHLSDQTAALAEPLAVAVHAVRRARLQVGDRVLVVGGGPIGLMVALTARLSGCSRIVLTEVAPKRIATATRFGFEAVPVNPDEGIETLVSRLSDLEPEVVFECTGHPSATSQMIELSSFCGQVVVVGAFKEPASLDLFRLSRKELDLTGSFAYGADDFGRALTLLAADEPAFAGLVTDTVSLEGVEDAIEMMQTGQCIKVLVHGPGVPL